MTKRRLTINLTPEQVAGLSLKNSDLSAAAMSAIDSYITAPAPAAGEETAALRAAAQQVKTLAAEIEQAKKAAKAAADKAAAELAASRAELEQAKREAKVATDKLAADLNIAKEAHIDLWARIGVLQAREDNWQKLVGEVIKTALK